MQEKLILLRQENGDTQSKLAKLIDITQKQYRLKELGKAKFNGDEMFLIAQYYRKKIDDIFLPTTHQNGDLNLVEE